MALKENIDFVVVKKGGYYDGRRTLQQHGNIIVTPNRMILNIIFTMDVIEKAMGESSHEQEYKNVEEPLNPFNVKKQYTAIKDAGSNIGVAFKDLKSSWKEAGNDFRKMKDQGRYHKLILDIAAECDSLVEFEERVVGLAEDHPKSLNIPVRHITEFKPGLFANAKMILDNGHVMKLIILKGKKDIKRILGK
ncbi:MAG: hypothetical protein CVU05_05505 [Bacteroidetes bacterium HGW-Bacteroidetes-21]|jgi:hypothetical protein|nr:MAG: hypothetical protein CVU05_05505 [Bacteroidetes bacterium HGW-Bacteroidetes-21]